VSFFFADNTVLVSFAIIGRMDLLETLFCDRGRWSATVRDECMDSARVPGLDTIAEADRFLGDPIAPTKTELLQTRAFRDRLAGPLENNPKKHLGEAETLSIMAERFRFDLLVTDDTGAHRLAAEHNIRTVTTFTLLKMAVRVGLATPVDVFDHLRDLRPRGAPHLDYVSQVIPWAND
jgi:predicted nucleic acid-binding protein